MPKPTIDQVCDTQPIAGDHWERSERGNGGTVQVTVTVSGRADLAQLRSVMDSLWGMYETDETREKRRTMKRQAEGGWP